MRTSQIPRPAPTSPGLDPRAACRIAAAVSRTSGGIRLRLAGGTPMIETLAFGRTGHQSTRTIFGAAALGRVTQAEADAALDVLLRYGINHIDVAASYGDAELRIAPWLKAH